MKCVAMGGWTLVWLASSLLLTGCSQPKWGYWYEPGLSSLSEYGPCKRIEWGLSTHDLNPHGGVNYYPVRGQSLAFQFADDRKNLLVASAGSCSKSTVLVQSDRWMRDEDGASTKTTFQTRNGTWTFTTRENPSSMPEYVYEVRSPAGISSVVAGPPAKFDGTGVILFPELAASSGFLFAFNEFATIKKRGDGLEVYAYDLHRQRGMYFLIAYENIFDMGVGESAKFEPSAYVVN